ncbi:MAG: hypothetical protein VCD66_15960 [Alphaproteobacteria bacterium]|jgi:hypothetical protein
MTAETALPDSLNVPPAGQFDPAAWLSTMESIGARVYWSECAVGIDHPLGCRGAFNKALAEQVAADPGNVILGAYLEQYRPDLFAPGMGRIRKSSEIPS